MILLYRIAISIYTLLVVIASLFNDKARLFIAGRKGIFDRLKDENIATHSPIWFHCASLGEFEQVRSIIDQLHDKGEKILLTFFSPSGYEIRKNYPSADWVFYLPTDSKKNATQFLALANPKSAIFVKYDLWYFYISQLKKNAIPSFLVSALFHSEQIFFRPIIGSLHREMLGCFDKIYLQNKESDTLLQDIDIVETSIVGDTRVDSVLERKDRGKKLAVIESFLGNSSKAIVLGSAYRAEIAVLKEALPNFKNEKIIIAPHEVDESNIVSIEKQIGTKTIRYSQFQEGKHDSQILIIDNIGTLFYTYQYAKLVFIGGGYKGGLHNTLEPAAFGVPICFGPRYENFVEATDMVNRECAFPIRQASDLKSLYSRLEEQDFYTEVTQTTLNYMQKSKGASQIILKEILQKK